MVKDFVSALPRIPKISRLFVEVASILMKACCGTAVGVSVGYIVHVTQDSCSNWGRIESVSV